MFPLSARLAAVLAAGSLVAPPMAAAQELSMHEKFLNCLKKTSPRGRPLPNECLDFIAERHDRWANEDVNEYGHASTLADWDQAEWRPCDSLMDFVHKTLPLAVNPKDKPNTVFLYWADFHEGYTVPTPRGMEKPDGLTIFYPPEVHAISYVVLRRNYDPRSSNQWVANQKYRALTHELRHVMRRDTAHVAGGDSVDTDGCTKRRVEREHQAHDSTVSIWPESMLPNCTVIPKWDCTKIEFPGSDGPDHPDNPDPAGDADPCGLYYISGSGYLVCKGAPISVCLPELEIRCRGRGGGLRYAACAVPDADARRPRSGIRAPGTRAAE